MRYERRPAAISGLAILAALASAPSIAGVAAESSGAPADAAYRNGIIYTVDAHDSVQQALAVRAGRIVYVGSAAGLAAWVGPARLIDNARLSVY